MMLADPGRVIPQLVRINGFIEDVGDEPVRVPRIVRVVIVAQGEIAELHSLPPAAELCRPTAACAGTVQRSSFEPGHVSMKYASGVDDDGLAGHRLAAAHGDHHV